MQTSTPGQNKSDKGENANGSGLVPFDPERYLGTVCQSGASTLEFVFDFESQEGTGVVRSLATRASVGDHLIIRVGHYGILGQLIEIKTPDISLANALSSHGRPIVPTPVGVVQFINTLDGKSGQVIPGIAKMPRLGCAVYVADASLIQLAAEANLKKEGSGKPIVLSLASLPDQQSTKDRKSVV